MATPRTVTGKVVDPSGNARAGTTVTARLSQACWIPGTQETPPVEVKATTASDGTWSIPLYANDDLTPTPTYYSVIEDGNTVPMVGVVPQGSGSIAWSS